MKVETAYPIASEEIEPFAAMFIGRMFARCTEAKAIGQCEYERALGSFWYGLYGLERIAVAARTATHFSIAMNNHIVQIARYIESEIGIDPMTADGWRWRD